MIIRMMYIIILIEALHTLHLGGSGRNSIPVARMDPMTASRDSEILHPKKYC